MIDASNLPDDTLAEYDSMMVQAVLSIDKIAPLAMSIWSDVVKELERRGKVELISGSFDDIGSALIRRLGAV